MSGGAAFDVSPAPTALLDAKGTILLANRALARLLDVPAESLQGRRWVDLCHPDDEAVVEEVLLAAEEDDLEHRLPGTAPRWLHLQVSPLDGDHPTGAAIVACATDVTDRRSAEGRLLTLALHDPLTGLANRILLLDRLGHALDRADRAGGPATVGVLFLDLDRFKVVNDSKGHAAGDHLLRAVADRLRRAVRPADTVARLGGDEFVVVCEDICGEPDVLAVARRLAAVLGQPIEVAGRDIVVTASIGAAVGAPDLRPDDLLRHADLAMYRAKAGGRACAIAYDPSMEQAVEARLDLETDLRTALREGQLRVVFQPQWSLADGSLIGVEALVRWAHPTRGLLGPGAFLDLAEETGLIREIGTYVLEASCATARRWIAADPSFVLAVNLSARQLDTPGFAALVAGVLDHHQLSPANLCVEVTETLLIDLHGGASRQLAQLRSLGVQVALDDFGTGWSSLSHLTSFPVDVVKVDRAFVAGLDDDAERARSKAVVSAVVGLAHDLGLTTVAEGAETAEHVERLRAIGCDSVQGFFLGRPEPSEAIDVLLAAKLLPTPAAC